MKVSVLFFIPSMILMLSLLSGCSSGQHAVVVMTPRATGTWTPLPTLTPLPTYTPLSMPNAPESPPLEPPPLEPLPPEPPPSEPPPATIPLTGGEARLSESIPATQQVVNIEAQAVNLASSSTPIPIRADNGEFREAKTFEFVSFPTPIGGYQGDVWQAGTLELVSYATPIGGYQEDVLQAGIFEAVPYATVIAIGGYNDDSLDPVCCNWPVKGRITSDVTANHIALDIATSLGTPVTAADAGRVVAAGWDSSGYGYRVIIDHDEGLQTLYAHLSGYPVAVGDEVSQGQMIGQIGSTGRSTGPHLHFEVLYYGHRISPWNFLN